MVMWCRRFGVASMMTVGVLWGAGTAHAETSKLTPTPSPLTSQAPLAPAGSAPLASPAPMASPAALSPAAAATGTVQPSTTPTKDASTTRPIAVEPGSSSTQPTPPASSVSEPLAPASEPNGLVLATTPASSDLAAGKGSGPVVLVDPAAPPMTQAVAVPVAEPEKTPAGQLLAASVQTVANVVQAVTEAAVALIAAPAAIVQPDTTPAQASQLAAPPLVPSLIVPPAFVAPMRYYHGLYPAGVVVSPWFLAFGVALVILGFVILALPVVRAALIRLASMAPRFDSSEPAL